MNAVSTIEPDAAVEHVSKQQLSTLIGVPPRAISRWLRGKDPIPHVGHDHQIMFPKRAALDWMVEHVPLIRPRLAQRGLV